MFPTLFRIGEFEISSFGVLVALGFLAAAWLSSRAFEEADLPRESAWQVMTWCMVGGILGAKLWFAAEQMARDPDASFIALFFSRAGMTWFGGFIGGAIFGAIACWREGLPFEKAFGQASPGLALGHAIGRVGCFLVGDDYGRATNVPWAASFPRGLPPTIDPETGEVFSVHPTMLYETLWLLPVVAWLWKRRSSSPFLFGEYLILGGLGRLWIEAFRLNPSLMAGLSNAQVVSLACIVVGVIGWIWRWRGARGVFLTKTGN